MAFDKIFYCSRCGSRLSRSQTACSLCGFDIAAEFPFGEEPQAGAGGIGWSEAANDSRLAKYQRSRRIYISFFTFLLFNGIAAMLIASGDLQLDQEGLLVLGMLLILFFFIAFYAVQGTRRYSQQWIGTVIRKQGDPGGKYKRQSMALIIALDSGETICHSISDPILFLSILPGDRVKNHQRADLRFLEKYDKRRDLYLYCASCAAQNDARAEFCRACGSPLFKGKETSLDSKSRI